ncbi:MAG: MinD/ParA family protein [Thermodesulfobacteriota bacterium]|nr:MinD/ParA family protein [Thermodesulfobacteriota bacterium]
MDQAEELRTIMNQAVEQKECFSPVSGVRGDEAILRCPRVISVTSGKGGVGKTNVVVNLALAFTRLGKKVLVLDADLGLANIDVLLGLAPRYTVEHLFGREKSFSEILIEGPGGMRIMPASSGVSGLVDLNETQKLFLLDEIDLMAENIDILLIDTGAGISSNVLYFNMAAPESIVIATPEPTSMTDAYALIKVLSTRCKKKDFMMLVNFVSDEEEAKGVFKKISKVADHFLKSLSIDYLGFIPFDEKLPLAVRHQKPVLEIFPKAPSSRHFEDLARAILERPSRSVATGGIQFFWKRLFESQDDLYQERGIV